MKDSNTHKTDPRDSDDHPYNQQEEKPDHVDRSFVHIFRIVLVFIVLMLAYRIYQGENVFDLLGNLFKNRLQAW